MLGGATYVAAHQGNKILVAIPLMFGFQQAFEGIQWLYLSRGSSSDIAGYGYLLFALILWPVYMPTFVFVLDEARRTVLKRFVILGALVALYFSGLLLTQPLSISELSGSIRYTFGFRLQWLIVPAYILAILGPLWCSSYRMFRGFSLGIAALALLSWKLHTLNFLSVWCFFSAIVSSMFYIHLLFQNSVRTPMIQR